MFVLEVTYPNQEAVMLTCGSYDYCCGFLLCRMLEHKANGDKLLTETSTTKVFGNRFGYITTYSITPKNV